MRTQLAQADDPAATLRAFPMSLDAIPRVAWERLMSASPAATPFSRWTFHRAWWDAYGDTAHEQYLVCVDGSRADTSGTARSEPAPDDLRAIVPLMHRHEVEPDDPASATSLRRHEGRISAVAPDAKAVFMAASYHADYATVLAERHDLPAVADAVAGALAGPPDTAHGARQWDVIDLRRFRSDDPALDALESAFRRRAESSGWHVQRELEDVCPVVTFEGPSWDDYLASLDKSARHEVRRKLRRAERSGAVTFELAPLDEPSVEELIRLHQARWGSEGLFPPTIGGDRSRRFLHRLTELESQEGEGAQLQLGRMKVGEQVAFASVGFDDGATCYFYNAGTDPSARDLSPGVTGTAAYLRDRLEAGRTRFDFLRGNEPYKYEWGAHDRPIHRLLVTRSRAA